MSELVQLGTQVGLTIIKGHACAGGDEFALTTRRICGWRRLKPGNAGRPSELPPPFDGGWLASAAAALGARSAPPLHSPRRYLIAGLVGESVHDGPVWISFGASCSTKAVEALRPLVPFFSCCRGRCAWARRSAVAPSGDARQRAQRRPRAEAQQLQSLPTPTRCDTSGRVA